MTFSHPAFAAIEGGPRIDAGALPPRFADEQGVLSPRGAELLANMIGAGIERCASSGRIDDEASLREEIERIAASAIRIFLARG